MFTATEERQLSGAVALLRESNANMILCWVSTALSLVLAGLGIASVEDKGENLDLSTRIFFAVHSVLFLLSQGFTAAKTLRDFHLGHQGEAPPEVTPTLAYVILVVVVFGFAGLAFAVAFEEKREEFLDLRTKKFFAVQSLLFLFSQAFTVAKTLRDFHLGRSGTASPEVAPTLAYVILVLVFFALAMDCAAYSLIIDSVDREWRAFFAMMILWLTLNALCLSKAVRDRQEASDLRGLDPEVQKRRLQYIWEICQGTTEYKLMLWFSTLASVGVMLGTMWSWSSEILVLERKGYISGMVLWCLFSSFHLAKLVRDREDPIKAKELRTQVPFQLLVVSSSVLSAGALIGGACAMPLALRQRLFLITGSCFAIASAFYLAKHIRDRFEAVRLQAPEVAVEAEVVESGLSL